MSVKNEASGRRCVQVEVEVPSTREEVRQATAAKPGISSWLERFNLNCSLGLCFASPPLEERAGRGGHTFSEITLVPAEFKERDGKLARYLRALLTVLALLIVLASARAQELPKPGIEHLKRLVGTWDAETESGKGTMTYKMGLDGLWLIGDFDGEFGGTKFEGKYLDTYDPATKKYRSIWVDSFSTAPRIMEGNLDKDNKVMTMTGEGPMHEGKAKFKSITEIKDADTVNFSLFMVDKDGKEQPTVKITYKRKK